MLSGDASARGQAITRTMQALALAGAIAADYLLPLRVDTGALYLAPVVLSFATPPHAMNAAVFGLALAAASAAPLLRDAMESGAWGQRTPALAALVIAGAVSRYAALRWRRLAEREAVSRATIESAVDGIVLIDETRRILYANPAAQRTFGYTEAELAGKNVSMLMPEPYRSGHDGYVENYLRTGERKIIGIGREVAGVRKDGTEFPMDLAVSEVKRAGGRIFVGVVRDVTGTKQAEARFQLAVEAAPNAMLLVDEKGCIVLANAQAETLFGYGREELMGMAVDRLVPARLRDGHPAMRGAYFNRPETRAMGAGRELFALRKDGTEFPVEIGLNPIRSGGESFVLSAVVDITQRKRADAAVQLRTRDLETIVYIVSHDLREPLRGITNLTSLFEQRYGGTIDDKGREMIGLVKGAAERLDRLILDLLELSRAQRADLPTGYVDGAEMVNDVLVSLRDRIATAGAVIEVAPDLPPVYVNRTWATQALYNLVNNALKFGPPDGPPAIRIEGRRFDSGPRRGEGFVVLDRGPGVEEESRERIFVLFQRAVDRGVEGVGAGLAIVREVAQRHNGAAWMEPRPGGGSAFYLLFGSEGSYERSV